MSGPKIDYAELERRKQEALERERQERLKQIRIATENYMNAKDECKKIAHQIKSYKESMLKNVSGRNELNFVIERISQTKNQFVEKINNLCDQTLPSEPEEILNHAAYIFRSCEKEFVIFESNVSAEFDRIANFLDKMSVEKEIEDFSEALEDYKVEKLQISDFAFVLKHIEENKVIDDSIKKETQNTISEIVELVNDDSLVYIDRKELVAFFKKIVVAADDTFTLKNILKEYELFREGVLQRKNHFNSLYSEYLTEYIVYLEELNQERDYKIEIQPKSKQSFESIDKLEREIATLKELSKYENEQNYIRRQLNEVMCMFGFSTCEEMIFSAEQKGYHYLCNNKKNHTAVHVHISDSNQVMMEIVGTQTENSSIESEGVVNAKVDKDLSKESISNLLNAQNGFCEIHPKIVEELKKRGIILHTKIHRLPNEIFCKSIVKNGNKKAKVVMDEKGIINSSNVRRKGKKKKELERKIK